MSFILFFSFKKSRFNFNDTCHSDKYMLTYSDCQASVRAVRSASVPLLDRRVEPVYNLRRRKDGNVEPAIPAVVVSSARRIFCWHEFS